MAYTVIRAENGGDASQGYYYEYLCASADDVATLPTEATNGGPRPGSLAYIESDSSARYILKVEREWGEYPMAGGGGSTGGGVMRVNVEMVNNQPTMDKTWQEINDFVEAGGMVFSPSVVDESETAISYVCGLNSDIFAVYLIGFGSDGTGTRLAFAAESADGYPVYDPAG